VFINSSSSLKPNIPMHKGIIKNKAIAIEAPLISMYNGVKKIINAIIALSNSVIVPITIRSFGLRNLVKSRA